MDRKRLDNIRLAYAPNGKAMAPPFFQISHLATQIGKIGAYDVNFT